MKVLVTGGAGFIGSHAAEYYAKLGHEVTIYDNLSRAQLLKKDDKNTLFNWNYLTAYKNILRIKADVRDEKKVANAAKDADVIIHTAGQTAVTTSIIEPREDFEVNIVGTFNVLEAARKSGKNPVIVDCSTNKVYGENVNNVKIIEDKKRYAFTKENEFGISENLPIDHCEHTPYGCSKLSADLYMQDYGSLYGLRTGTFRMSCIYGTRQFGVEDQGWVAWFTIATILNKSITIYGDGKQVRDVLFVEDVIRAYDKFVQGKQKHSVFNMGGGYKNTISLLELLDILEKLTGKRSRISFGDWRPSDQKVYISDIRKAQKELSWFPEISPEQGIKKLADWVMLNKDIFKER